MDKVKKVEPQFRLTRKKLERVNKIENEWLYDLNVDLLDAKIRMNLGNNWGLFDAIYICSAGNLPLPFGFAKKLDKILSDYENGEVKDLDEAFGFGRPKGWNQAGARTRARDEYSVKQYIQEFLNEGENLKTAFERVKEKLPHVSAAQAQKHWYFYRKRFSKKPSVEHPLEVRRYLDWLDTADKEDESSSS